MSNGLESFPVLKIVTGVMTRYNSDTIHIVSTWYSVPICKTINYCAHILVHTHAWRTSYTHTHHAIVTQRTVTLIRKRGEGIIVSARINTSLRISAQLITETKLYPFHIVDTAYTRFCTHVASSNVHGRSILTIASSSGTSSFARQPVPATYSGHA